MLTFGIIGDLAFGETFGGVETGVEHPWIAINLGALTQGALADALKCFPTLAMIATPLLLSKIKELTEDVTGLRPQSGSGLGAQTTAPMEAGLRLYSCAPRSSCIYS